MDEPEREYLRQHIQSLENANRRWKVLACFHLAAFGLFMILGMGTAFFTQGRLGMERMLAEQARREAEAQVDQARQAEMQAKQAAEKAAQREAAQKATPAEGEAMEKSKAGPSLKQIHDGKQTPER